MKIPDIGIRPIFFFGNCLGGLLIKEFLYSSLSKFPQLLTQTKGVLFYGVPHLYQGNALLNNIILI